MRTRKTKTLLQQMLEIDCDESREEFFKDLTLEQREEVVSQIMEALEPVLSFVRDVYIPAANKVLKTFSELMRATPLISPLIEQYVANKEADAEEVMKNAILMERK